MIAKINKTSLNALVYSLILKFFTLTLIEPSPYLLNLPENVLWIILIVLWLHTLAGIGLSKFQNYYTFAPVVSLVNFHFPDSTFPECTIMFIKENLSLNG